MAAAAAAIEFMGVCYDPDTDDLNVWHHPVGWPMPPPCGPQPNTAYHSADELGISAASINQHNRLLDAIFSVDIVHIPRASKSRAALVVIDIDWKRTVRHWLAWKRRLAVIAAWERA